MDDYTLLWDSSTCSDCWFIMAMPCIALQKPRDVYAMYTCSGSSQGVKYKLLSKDLDMMILCTYLKATKGRHLWFADVVVLLTPRGSWCWQAKWGSLGTLVLHGQDVYFVGRPEINDAPQYYIWRVSHNETLQARPWAAHATLCWQDCC